jgi:hypothetical protein
MTVAADAAACFKDDSGERATMIFLDPSGLMIELKAFAACGNASIATKSIATHPCIYWSGGRFHSKIPDTACCNTKVTKEK